MSAQAKLAAIAAMPVVRVVAVRSGIEIPNRNRPIPGEVLELAERQAAALLGRGAVDLADARASDAP